MSKKAENIEEETEDTTTESGAEPETAESNGWVSDFLDTASQKAIANPVKSAIATGIVADQVSKRIVSPAVDWTVDAVKGLFANGAEAAVEEAVQEEAVAAATGGALDGVLSNIGKAYKVGA